MTKSYKNYWTDLIACEQSEYEETAQDDPFDNWDRLVSPDVRMEMPLVSGLELACGGGKAELIATFFDQCLLLTERGMAEEIYRRKVCRGLFPLNRARIVRARTYAQWLRQGQLDRDALRGSIEDFLTWSNLVYRSDWNEFHQSYYISALSMSLLADRTLTEMILGLNYSCPDRVAQFDTIRRLALTYLQDKRTTPLPLDEYDACFDEVRCPTRPQHLPSFEMGYVRLLVYPQRDGPLDPSEAVQLMSQ